MGGPLLSAAAWLRGPRRAVLPPLAGAARRSPAPAPRRLCARRAVGLLPSRPESWGRPAMASPTGTA
eukprot:1437305-Alexandrium_andersonii.AAC.1